MTFSDLQSFITIYQLRNVSDAAVELSMTQSSLSKHMQALQEELNTKLISTNNRRHLTITESGEVFYRYALTILTQYGLLQNELQDLKELKRGEITVSSVPVMAQYGLLSKLRQFMDDYPQINIHLEELEGSVLVNQLQDHQTNLGILRDVQTKLLNSTQFDHLTIEQDELTVILPANHPLAKMETLTMTDLVQYDIVSLNPGSGVFEQVSQLYQAIGFTPNIRFMTTHIETLLGMVARSDLITFLYKKAATPFLDDRFASKSLSQPITSDLQIVYDTAQLSPAAQRLIGYFK